VNWEIGIFELDNGYLLVLGTTATRSRRQLMKPQVEVKSMNHIPAADYGLCRRR